MVIVGDTTPDAALASVKRVFGSWPAAARPTPTAPPMAAAAPPAIHLVDRPGAPQSEFRIGTVGAPRTSPAYFPLIVLNTILGGSFTSRLNTRLREQGGYTYGAFSGFSFRTSAGPFVAGAAVHTDVTAQASAETLEEFGRMRDEPVPHAELERAKHNITLGLPRAFETNGGVAARVAEIEVYGLGNDYWSLYADRVHSVDAAAVQQAAREYLDVGRMSMALVGDAARVRGPLAALGLGPIIDEQPPD
jgi:predicted Zn-dependent peptidase